MVKPRRPKAMKGMDSMAALLAAYVLSVGIVVPMSNNALDEWKPLM